MYIYIHVHVVFYFYFLSLIYQSSSDQQLDCALDLMRRLPPQQIEKNLSDLIELVRNSN